MRILLSSAFGIIGTGGIAFVYFAALFTYPTSGAFGELVLGCAFAAALFGALVGVIARQQWRPALVSSLLPFAGIAFLLVLGGFQAGFDKNLSGIVGAGTLMVVFSVSLWLAVWIVNRSAGRTTPKNDATPDEHVRDGTEGL
jgi:Ca2+/Na+ antiporter